MSNSTNKNQSILNSRNQANEVTGPLLSKSVFDKKSLLKENFFLHPSPLLEITNTFRKGLISDQGSS